MKKHFSTVIFISVLFCFSLKPQCAISNHKFPSKIYLQLIIYDKPNSSIESYRCIVKNFCIFGDCIYLKSVKSNISIKLCDTICLSRNKCKIYFQKGCSKFISWEFNLIDYFSSSTQEIDTIKITMRRKVVKVSGFRAGEHVKIINKLFIDDFSELATKGELSYYLPYNLRREELKLFTVIRRRFSSRDTK